MSNSKTYYLSRVLISGLMAGIFLILGAAWWQASLVLVLSISFFLWAPRSGRYLFQPKKGVTANRRDERSRSINHQAGRNAFVIMSLAIAALVAWSGALGLGHVPVNALGLTLLLGALTYFASDFWLRRT